MKLNQRKSTTMETAYVNNVPLAHGELSLVMSVSADEAVHHSWQLATECQRLGIGVLLVNTGFSKRRFTMADPRDHRASAAKRESSQTREPLLMVHSSNRGNVVGEANEIAQVVRDCKIGVVIFTSWEWSASNYGRSRSLRYFLREIMEDEEVAVIVYSQAPTTPKPGYYDRGGTGRLAEMAVGVADVRGTFETQAASPRPGPIVATSTYERRAMEETVRRATQLVANEINHLAIHLPDDGPSDTASTANADPGLNLSVISGSKEIGTQKTGYARDVFPPKS